MPKYIIKPRRDRDFYVEWSTIVDSIVGYGTRSEFLEEGYEPERLRAADIFGTSSKHLGDGGWGQAIFEMRIERLGIRRNHLYLVERKNLELICAVLENGDIKQFLCDKRKNRKKTK